MSTPVATSEGKVDIGAAGKAEAAASPKVEVAPSQPERRADDKAEAAAQAPAATAAQAPAPSEPAANVDAKPQPKAAAAPRAKPTAGASAKADAARPKLTPAAPAPASAPSNGPSVSGAEAARALRQARARRLIAGLAVWVGLPVLLATIYYGVLAQPQFESVAAFAVRGSDATARAAMLRTYISAPEMRKVLDKNDHFTEHFKKASDPLARLARKAGSEARAASYRQHVTTDYDAQAGILTLKVRAFSGAAAAAFANTITSECRRLFKRIDEDVSKRRVGEAEKDLAAARDRLLAAERALAMGAAVASTPEAIADARVRQVTRDMAEREVDAALTALSRERTSVREREAPFVTISKPSTPTEAAYPRRLYGVMTVLFVSLGLFGVGSLLISAVREHAQF